jgi:hypothetical protein
MSLSNLEFVVQIVVIVSMKKTRHKEIYLNTSNNDSLCLAINGQKTIKTELEVLFTKGFCFRPRSRWSEKSLFQPIFLCKRYLVLKLLGSEVC